MAESGSETDGAGPVSSRGLRLPEWGRSATVHEWIRSVGIVVAFTWGMYTFIWKEIVVPEMAPASLNLQMSLTPTGRSRPAKDGRPANVEFQLTVSASNPSRRNLYLLASYWQLKGMTVVGKGEDPDFAANLNDTLAGDTDDQVQRHASLTYSPSLGMGRLFLDDVIHPGETLSRNLLLHVPATYQAAAVDLLIPGLTKRPDQALWQGRRLRWGFSADEVITPLLCGPEEQQDCRPAAPTALEKELLRFDNRAVVFRAMKETAL